MRRCIILLSLLVLASCNRVTKEERETYTDFLYESMPLPDSLSYNREFWEENVTKTLEVRNKMDWNIPEREFRHFVLPLRVNNETLDDFRTIYADSLCARVKGMSLKEAALEINHWCHERATYQPSDSRTSAPMATIRRGVGRCGEESVLAVAALRAAGIPARQVYTPRWAHTDDNHAWVEVWADGKWWFMGACEPEPRLNMGWFNAPVSRAMLLHTKVFGKYDGEEDVISRNDCYTEINVIKGYVDSRRTNVTVLDSLGKAVEGADVSFMIYNYAELYPVATYHTGEDGRAGLDTGNGDITVFARKGDLFGLTVARDQEDTVVLSHHFGESFGMDLNIVPPPENPIVTDATEEEIAKNAERIKAENAYRETHTEGNAEVIDAFKASHPDCPTAMKNLIATLSEKDRTDVTAAVLEDAILHWARSSKMQFDKWSDSPRIENEELRPFFEEMKYVSELDSVDVIARWIRDSITIVEGRNPQNLRIPPVSVWKSRMCDAKSLDIFFVAMCRAAGYSARINEVTGQTQFKPEEGNWTDISLYSDEIIADKQSGTIEIQYSPSAGAPQNPLYYRHFTISKLENGTPRLLTFPENEDVPVSKISTIKAEPGYYMMTSGSRMADGSVCAHIQFFPVVDSVSTQAPLVMRTSDGKVSVVGSIDPEVNFLQEGKSSQQSILSATGRGYFILALMGSQDEPSNHAIRELEAASSILNKWGQKVVILTSDRKAEGLNAVYGNDPGEKVRRVVMNGCGTSSWAMPLIVVADSFGRVVYFSQGYNTSLCSDLQGIIPQL